MAAESGKVILSAVTKDGLWSYGYEMPESKNVKCIFDAAMVASATATKDEVEGIGETKCSPILFLFPPSISFT